MRRLFISLAGIIIFGLCGCETPSNTASSKARPHPSIEGLTVTDLEDKSAQAIQTEHLLVFRILTYEIGAEGLNELQSVIEELSQREIRYREKKAFKQNGFACAAGMPEQGAKIAQLLAQIGAERRGASRLMLLAGHTEIFSTAPFQAGVPVIYWDGDGTSATITPAMGLGGWTLNAKPDPRFRGMVQVSAAPAFWLSGAEDLRLRLGQEPIEYQFIEEGRFLARIEERGFLVLVPNRRIPVENTLDRALFHIFGRKAKMRFFVIICDHAGD